MKKYNHVHINGLIIFQALVSTNYSCDTGAMVQHPGLCPDWDDPVYDGVLQVGNCPNDCRKSLNDYDCKDTERCCPTPCSANSWMCVPPSIKVMFKPPPWAKTTPQPRPETTPQPQPITETTLQPTFGKNKTIVLQLFDFSLKTNWVTNLISLL